jgi:hypothetical protein
MSRTSEGGMDADVERFFEECRADPRYRQQPELIGVMIDKIEERFEKFDGAHLCESASNFDPT